MARMHPLTPLMGSILLHSVGLLGLVSWLPTHVLPVPRGGPVLNFVELQGSFQAPSQSVRRAAAQSKSVTAETESSNANLTATGEKVRATGTSTLGSENGVSNAGALAEYLFGLRQLFENKKVYPALSRKMGEMGKVLIAFEVLQTGEIREVKIKISSNVPRLDEAALETVASVQSYLPIPHSIGETKLKVEVPLDYTL